MTMLEQQEQVENTEQYTEQKFGIWNSKYSNYKKMLYNTQKREKRSIIISRTCKTIEISGTQRN